METVGQQLLNTIDEIDALKVENKRLTLLHEISERQAQIEIERLRAALQEIVDSIEAVSPAAPMLERALRALEPKP